MYLFCLPLFRGSTRQNAADLEFFPKTVDPESWLGYLHLSQTCRRGREGIHMLISTLNNLQYQRCKICRLSVFNSWTLNIQCSSENTLKYFQVSIWGKKITLMLLRKHKVFRKTNLKKLAGEHAMLHRYTEGLSLYLYDLFYVKQNLSPSIRYKKCRLRYISDDDLQNYFSG